MRVRFIILSDKQQENKATSPLRLKQMLRTVAEYDMAEMKDFDLRNARKMLQLLSIIARQGRGGLSFSGLYVFFQ